MYKHKADNANITKKCSGGHYRDQLKIYYTSRYCVLKATNLKAF